MNLWGLLKFRGPWLKHRFLFTIHFLFLLFIILNYKTLFNYYRFSENNISSKGASLLFNTLKVCKSSVETIDLYDNQLDDDCIESLGEFIQNSQAIENIDISEVIDGY